MTEVSGPVVYVPTEAPGPCSTLSSLRYEAFAHSIALSMTSTNLSGRPITLPLSSHGWGPREAIPITAEFADTAGPLELSEQTELEILNPLVPNTEKPRGLGAVFTVTLSRAKRAFPIFNRTHHLYHSGAVVGAHSKRFHPLNWVMQY